MPTPSTLEIVTDESDDREQRELRDHSTIATRSDITRIDGNFLIVEAAIKDVREKTDKLAAKWFRPRRHRTGSAARFDPDTYKATPWLVIGMLVFVVTALVAAFSGQIAMAPYTTLPPQLYWLVPVFIDLPIILLAYVVQVFRRRKQRVWTTWVALIAFTAGSSAIQVIHVLSAQSIIVGTQIRWDLITPEIAVGTAIMGLAPWIVLYSWEQLTKLLVKPYGEKREEPAKPAARKRTTRKKAPK